MGYLGGTGSLSSPSSEPLSVACAHHSCSLPVGRDQRFTEQCEPDTGWRPLSVSGLAEDICPAGLSWARYLFLMLPWQQQKSTVSVPGTSEGNRVLSMGQTPSHDSIKEFIFLSLAPQPGDSCSL